MNLLQAVPRRALALGRLTLAALLLAACQPAPGTQALQPDPTAAPVAAATDVAPTAQPIPTLPATLAPAIATAAPAQTAAPVAQPAAPAAAFSSQRAHEHVRHLAESIGSRVAGTPAQSQAADYLLRQFESAGLTGELQEFQFSGFDDRGSSLEISTAGGGSVSTNTLAYSPAGEVSGELLPVGLARAGDFEGSTVRGKVALAERGEIRFGDKVANLAAAGAVGVVIYNNAPGSFAGSLAAPGAVPAVSISQQDGDRLLGLAQQGNVLARLKVDSRLRQATGHNVIATKQGGAKTVVIGGHFDSVAAGPGANDNGSGTATVLELARIIAGRSYPFSIRFVAFDAEEIGLLGSAHYVRQLDDAARAQTVAMINLDMVGVGNRLGLGGDPVLVEKAARLARGSGIDATPLRGMLGMSSDHASFQSASIPSLFVNRGEDPRYHTADDRAEFVLTEHLEVAGQLVLSVLDELAAEHP